MTRPDGRGAVPRQTWQSGHATEITTAVRNIAPMLLMMIFPFRADPLVTVSITILNTIGLVTVLLFALMWRRAATPSEPSDTPAPTSQRVNEDHLATTNLRSNRSAG